MEDPKLLLEEEKEFKRFYRLSLWWVEHRSLLRKLGLGFFLCVDSILLLFVLWAFLDSFAISYGDDQREVAKLAVYGQADLRAYTIANRAQDIILDSVRVFPLGGGRYDFYTTLSNPNEDWWVEFEYHFVHGAGGSEPMKGFLLPGQSKPIVALAVVSESPISSAGFELTNVMWHRLDHHEIADYPTWQKDRLALEILNPTFAEETGFEGDQFGRTTFTVQNNTAFSYFDPEFYVLLKRGAAVVGVNRATVASLGAGEEVELTLNWFGTLPAVSAVEVIPDVHLFDPSVYQRPEGETGVDTRARDQRR